MSRTTNPSRYAFESDVLSVDRPVVKVNRDDPFWSRKMPKMAGGSPLLDTQGHPILNKKGEIVLQGGKIVRGGMYKHQRKWWKLPDFIKVLVGGYGSGKTFIGAKRIIASALENAPAMVAVVSPTFPLARRTVIPTIEALLAGKQTHYGHQFWWKYNRSTHEFKIRFRGRTATILILSGEIPSSLRGPNLASAWLDEPFLMEREVFTQMIARVRHPDAKHKEILLTGTPEQLNWGYDLCMGELKEDLEEYGNVTVGMIQASSRDNLTTGSDYVKRLEGAFSEKEAAAFVDGSFVNLSEGLVYYGFTPLDSDPMKINVQKLPIPDDAELGVGMDFNVNPMAASIFWKQGLHMHFFDEIELKNADTEFMCDDLYEKYVADETRKTKQRLEYVYPDASGSARKTSAPGGLTDFHYIRKAGFTIRAHSENPKRKDRYNAVNGKFRPKTGTTTLTIDPACKRLTKYLQTHSYEMFNKQESMKHLLDSFSYPVEFLFPIKREAAGLYKLSGL